MGSKKPKMEVVEYYMSMHQVICHGPVDEIRGVIMAEKEAWKGVYSTNGSFVINKPDLHGGVKKEGGAVGRVEVLLGGVDQDMPNYLAQKMGLTTATCPAYRGMASLFFSGTRHRGFYWTANQPYLRSIWVVAKRFARGLSSSYMAIGNDANPAHIIYEVLTNKTWGEGTPSSMLDMQSLEDLAKLMFEENFGLSLLWVNQGTIESFITEILDHIQAALFVNPRTGLLTVKALRNDYDPATLRTLTPDNAKLSKFQRKGWGETTNEIVVTWTNPENEQEETVSMIDAANNAMQGGTVSESRNYYAVRNKDKAMELAARDLRSASAPLAICSALVDRSGWDIVPGECVKVNWPERGLNDVVFRVVDVDYGMSTDTSVRLNLTEDIFSFTTASYVSPPGTEWVDPSEDPTPLKDYLIFTLPYSMVFNMVDSDSLIDFQIPQVIAGVLGAQSGQDTHEFDIVSPTTPPTGTGYDDGDDETSLTITAQGNLVQALAAEATSTNVNLLNITSGSLAQVGMYVIFGENDRDMEICLITADGSSGMTLRRGVYDTIPRAWSVGSRAWLVAPNSIIYDPQPSSEHEIVSYKMLPRTSKGRLPWSAAPVVSGMMTNRPWAPNRPARCRVNNVGFGDINLVGVPAITLTWANRNRLMEDTQVMAWEESNVTPEANQTTNIVVYNEQGAEVNRISGLTGATYSMQRESFLGLAEAQIGFEAERDGIRSIQDYRLKVILDAQEPGHRYWRLLFEDGSISAGYVQLVRVAFFANYQTNASSAISTLPVDGVGIASSFDSSQYVAQNAFNDDATSWCSKVGESDIGQWVGFHFNTPQRIMNASYLGLSPQGSTRIPKTATLQWSDDGTTWTSQYAKQPYRTGSFRTLMNDPAKLPVNDNRPHRFWRVRSYSRIDQYIQYNRVKFMLAGVEKSVGGTASASTIYGATYPASAAFNDTTSYWCTTSGAGNNDWLQYEFVEPTRIDRVTLAATGGASKDGGTYIFIDYSDDGQYWTCAKFHNVAQAANHTIDVL